MVETLHAQLLPIGTAVEVLRLVIDEGVSFELHFRSVRKRLWPDAEGDAELFQLPVGQWEILGGVRRGGPDGKNGSVDLLQMLQIRHGVVDVARRHCDAKNHPMVTVHRLVGEVVRSLRLARALHMVGFLVRAAYTFMAAAAIFLDLLYPFLPPFPRPPLQLLQALLFIGVQPLPVRTRLLRHFHKLLRCTGRVRFHMGGVRPYYPSAGQAFCDALSYHFLKQPPEYLPE